VFKKPLDISCLLDNIVSMYVGIDHRKTPQRLARPRRPCVPARFPQLAPPMSSPKVSQKYPNTARINVNNADNVNNAVRAAPDVFTTCVRTSLPRHDIGRIRSPLTNLHPTGFLLSSTLFFLFLASNHPRRSPNSLQAFNLTKVLPTTAFPSFAW